MEADHTDEEFWGRTRARPRLLDRLEDLRQDSRARVLALIAAALVAGIVWYGLGRSESAAGPSPGPSTTAEPAGVTGTTAPETVTVHVAGAVVHPGVVALAGGRRVIDAIEAVGGAQPDADLDRLNLAAVLHDGERVAVARIGEPVPPGPSGGGGSGAAASGGPVDLNTATVAELETLPGIGPSLAAAIVEERERRGRFESVEDLESVPGIGERRLAELRPHVTV